MTIVHCLKKFLTLHMSLAQTFLGAAMLGCGVVAALPSVVAELKNEVCPRRVAEITPHCKLGAFLVEDLDAA